MSDDAKKSILARRAKFVAAAMAGLAASGCGKDSDPRACLKVSIPRDRDDVPPQVCLSPPPLPVDAGRPERETPSDAGVGDAGDAASPVDGGDGGTSSKSAGDAGARPTKPSAKPCLLMMPPPREDEER